LPKGNRALLRALLVRFGGIADDKSNFLKMCIVKKKSHAENKNSNYEKSIAEAYTVCGYYMRF
jgi:hypothetical protein